jgi:hypothetical protein
VSAVLKAGAPDNATVIVVDVHPLDGSVDRTDAAHADG